jgi:pimeloyl-ACP methyl ester carboxylesterase
LPKKVINQKWVFNYTIQGKGTPIVLLHGLGGNPSQWHEYVASLAPYHTVIVPNLSHLFYSSDRLSFAHQAQILKEYLIDMGREFGVLGIAGQSYGGTLALAVAIKELTIVDRVILINPIPPWPIRYFRNSFLRFFMRTSTLLSQLKSGLLETQVGVQFLKELSLVFPWRWLLKMVNDESFSTARYQRFHLEMERFAWIFQKEVWDQWTQWQVPSHRSLLIYDPNDPLFNPVAYPDLIEKLKIEHVIKLKYSGHILVPQNKFEIQLGIRRFMEPGYNDEFKIQKAS